MKKIIVVKDAKRDFKNIPFDNPIPYA